jgi:DNA-binding response OmpR family regulator
MRFGTDHRRVVLVVDDEPDLRHLVARTLPRGQYAVFEAADGWDALSMAYALAPRLDLVITDLSMPVMDGYTLAQHLLHLSAPPAILFITGRDDMPAEGFPAGLMLRKPFHPDALVAFVERLLQVGHRVLR